MRTQTQVYRSHGNLVLPFPPKELPASCLSLIQRTLRQRMEEPLGIHVFPNRLSAVIRRDASLIHYEGHAPVYGDRMLKGEAPVPDFQGNRPDDFFKAQKNEVREASFLRSAAVARHSTALREHDSRASVVTPPQTPETGSSAQVSPLPKAENTHQVSSRANSVQAQSPEPTLLRSEVAADDPRPAHNNAEEVVHHPVAASPRHEDTVVYRRSEDHGHHQVVTQHHRLSLDHGHHTVTAFQSHTEDNHHLAANHQAPLENAIVMQHRPRSEERAHHPIVTQSSHDIISSRQSFQSTHHTVLAHQRHSVSDEYNNHLASHKDDAAHHQELRHHEQDGHLHHQDHHHQDHRHQNNLHHHHQDHQDRHHAQDDHQHAHHQEPSPVLDHVEERTSFRRESLFGEYELGAKDAIVVIDEGKLDFMVENTYDENSVKTSLRSLGLQSHDPRPTADTPPSSPSNGRELDEANGPASEETGLRVVQEEFAFLQPERQSVSLTVKLQPTNDRPTSAIMEHEKEVAHQQYSTNLTPHHQHDDACFDCIAEEVIDFLLAEIDDDDSEAHSINMHAHVSADEGSNAAVQTSPHHQVDPASPKVHAPYINDDLLAELKQIDARDPQSIHDSLHRLKTAEKEELAQREAATAAEIARVHSEWGVAMFLPLIPKFSDKSGQPVPDWRRNMLAAKRCDEAVRAEEARLRSELEEWKQSKSPNWKRQSSLPTH